jgi:hypothetical protein
MGRRYSPGMTDGDPPDALHFPVGQAKETLFRIKMFLAGCVRMRLARLFQSCASPEGL